MRIALLLAGCLWMATAHAQGATPPLSGEVLPILSAAQGAPALPSDAPPEWSDEPPLLSRLIEQAYEAQRRQQVLQAAERYCAAARLGSLEAQYRLGRLYLQRHDDAGKAEGRAMLALAAQRGHEKALLALGQEALTGAELPECLLTGVAPKFEVPDGVVPQEVVARFVEALPNAKRRLAELVQALAPRFDVDYRFALAIVRAESNFDPLARSPKNAMGLMQLIPETAERFGVRDPFDPEQNVRGGLSYLRWLLHRFEGSVALASAAYNAGEGAVDKFGGVPPYEETQEYVRRILAFYRAAKHVRPGPL